MSNHAYRLASRGILGLATNVQGFHWIFGRRMPEVAAEEFAQCRVRLQLEAASHRECREGVRDLGRERCGRYGYAQGEPGSGRLVYERTLGPGLPLFLEVRGAASDVPLVRANHAYLRTVQLRFMNLQSVSHVLVDLASLLLLRQSLAPVYCAAFRLGTATAAVFAPSNTGKTFTILRLCLEHGADFISEDISITDGRTLYGVPWTHTVRTAPGGGVGGLGQQVRRRLPILEPFLPNRAVPLVDQLPASRLCAASEATHLVFLERGPRGVREESPAGALQRMLNLNRMALNYPRSMINNALEFLNPAIDVAGAMEAEQSILRTFTQNVKGRWVVSTENPEEFSVLVPSLLA